MSEFHLFAKQINNNFLHLLGFNEVFVIEDTLDLFETYLNAFPEGSNPLFRTKTVHDCSCCRRFVRNVGGLVAFDDAGNRHTIWDSRDKIPQPYKSVAVRMSEMVRQYPIATIFRTTERSFGAEHTYGERDNPNTLWDHLFTGPILNKYSTINADAQRGEYNTRRAMLETALKTFKETALTDVQELIANNSLYRGEEHLSNLNHFLKVLRSYKKACFENRESDFIISKATDIRAATFKNSVIGTLIADLSEGVDLEQAVRMFEAKVAPANYKRSKSLVTEAMIDKAFATLDSLGIKDSIERRSAVFKDISINDVLFASNTGRMKLKDGLKSQILATHSKPKSAPKVFQPISILSFVDNVLPRASEVRVHVTNAHANNFVALTAPAVDPTQQLFAWDNSFAWSYINDVTDSVIREKVKRAGGNVTSARLRVSLAWFGHTDLDLHSDSPYGHVYYSTPKGILDVDMNAGFGKTMEPVENQSFINLPDGTYKFYVDLFADRPKRDREGFEIEVELNGKITQFSYPHPVTSRTTKLFELVIEKGSLIGIKNMNSKLLQNGMSRTIWNIPTETTIPVTCIMNSPNYWTTSKQTGQRHWFFMLDECQPDEPVRGIYVEYLRNELVPHRKVFEILGSKTKCQPVPGQMAGIGFTLGRDQTLDVFIDTQDGKFESYKINF